MALGPQEYIILTSQVQKLASEVGHRGPIERIIEEVRAELSPRQLAYWERLSEAYAPIAINEPPEEMPPSGARYADALVPFDRHGQFAYRTARVELEEGMTMRDVYDAIAQVVEEWGRKYGTSGAEIGVPEVDRIDWRE